MVSLVDTSAIITMKNAAKRDINCELQNSVNHRNFERIAALGYSLSYASLSIIPKNPKFNVYTSAERDCVGSYCFVMHAYVS